MTMASADNSGAGGRQSGAQTPLNQVKSGVNKYAPTAATTMRTKIVAQEIRAERAARSA